MRDVVDIGIGGLAAGYLLLLLPLGVLLWYRVPLLGRFSVGVVRMTVQLVLVGLYLQVVFRLDHPLLTGAWLLVMIGVADVSIVRGCDLALRRFLLPLFLALVAGTAIPLAVLVGVTLDRPGVLEAQYAIPIGGMILGNCLRADLIGLKQFYGGIRRREKVYLVALAQGARLGEAVRPFIREALELALAPTVATMATVGLVALPGMMTGAVLGGVDPLLAIQYQIAIMIAIVSGTAVTLVAAIWLTVGRCFTPLGVLDRTIFRR